MTRSTMLAMSAMAAALFAANGAWGEAYPSRAVRMVVPNAPGGPSDLVARLVSDQLSRTWGQPVIVDNRAGAGGNIGLEAVAKSPADGYTLLLTASGSISINPSIYRHLPFDPIKDFAPVSLVASTAMLALVPPSLGVDSVAQLVDLAKSKPGHLNYGSTGIGNNSHLLVELLKLRTGVNMVHVAYRSISQVYAALMSNEVALYFVDTASGMTYVRAAKLKALAVTSKSRLSAAPDVPTFVESGYPDFLVSVWLGLFAPGNTDRDVVAFVNRSVQRALDEPNVRQRLQGVGFEIGGGTPERLAAQLEHDLKQWAIVVKAANIKGE